MRWRNVLILLMLMLFIAGLGILLYPFIQGAMVDRQISMNAQAFLEDKDAQTQSHAIIVPDSTEGTEPEVALPDKYPELYLAMQDYNTQIWEEKQSGLCDPWSYEQPSFDLTEYGISDEVFGVISIPALQLEMPIFLGATSQHMADGAAHLSQTSLPVGGNNTNCVIAGHRGYNGASYFRYITDLQVGDTVTITNLWETISYTVTSTDIIEPTDVSKILIQENREMLTLLTCHPYASGGRQRYVVYCERNYEMEV
ncbi:MAG: class C sortase [Oscillospiraceae bacterium]|nr:class C sortase [Oscillospiraceae bacterium]